MTRSERATARIAVDLLGGDRAPAVVVDGALHACGADPDLHLHLVGPSEVTDQVRFRLPADRVTVAEPPAGTGARGAVRAAMTAVATGAADAAVSAGDSGAIVTAAVRALGRAPAVRRPALAAVVPGAAGPVVLLDVGASPDASANVLVRHAVLGTGYATTVLGIAAPRVGLLSIGTEQDKGDRVRRAAGEALRGRVPGFVGNVEGYDVPLGGRADVVVTDGFTGNVLLKGIEGAFALAGGEANPGVVPRAAALLGVPGTVVVCHGAADAAAVASGITLAARLHRTRAGDTGAGESGDRLHGYEEQVSL